MEGKGEATWDVKSIFFIIFLIILNIKLKNYREVKNIQEIGFSQKGI